MSKRAKKWFAFSLRWGVAVVGVTYVIWNLNFHDHLKVLTDANRLEDLQVVGSPDENSAAFRVFGSYNGEPPAEHVVPREQVWARPNLKSLEIKRGGEPETVKLLALRPP